MASAHQIRDLITQTTSGTVRPRVPREVRDYAVRRRKAGAAWSLIARETGLGIRSGERSASVRLVRAIVEGLGLA
jgi:hypothetical protein